ncbi:cytochrome P450 [Clavibacter michiganensis subsp. michiganensis]|nr:cytochrome P450 [Clavibacter michiganensis subsp. michiganensis]UGY87866.1 cytochrome P450 [Clavibacter michiganensis]MWJ01978.1 cytochrome P450 [Clavibacter michiganensis subsp. michiganensis]MWJ08019.1 cytochrome P450 [Clavibacter michiganensis subsp. michiganensis]MWJ16814.1 cytochrome P450 [Clavibacter michiganensis subsp. michiganensis]
MPTLESAPVPRGALPQDRCPFDPSARYERLREEDPVTRVTTPAGFDVWLVSRYDDARAVLGDGESFSNVDASSTHLMGNKDKLGATPPPGILLRHDGASHSRLRLRLAREFMVKRVATLEPFIRSLVAEHIDRLASMSGPVDLYRNFGLPIPALVISEVLGVPDEDRAEFGHFTASQVDLTLPLEEREAAGAAGQAFFARLVASKYENPGDDLLSRLIQEPSDEPFGFEELMGLSLLLLAAGHDTTANMITLGTYALLRNPDQAARLGEPGMMSTGVDELIRYLSIVHNGVLRKAVRDVTVGDQLVRAGEHVAVVLESANRDPRFMSDADRLDLDRRSAHVGFGYGAHQCLGQHLARLELTVALPELFRRVQGLRAVQPESDIPFKNDMLVYGIRELLVEWDEVVA